MKTLKRVLPIILSFAMIISTFAFVMNFSASAAESNIVFAPNAYERHYGWGGHPDKVEYTSGGYVTASSENHFQRQEQVYFVFNSTATKNAVVAGLEKANSEDGNGLIAVDVLVNQMSCSNFEVIQENQGAEASVSISFKYKDPDYIDDTIDDITGEPVNAEGWVGGSFTKKQWVSFNTLSTLKIPVDDYAMFIEGSDMYEEAYSDFTVVGAYVNIMNYGANAFTSGDYKGQAGIGFTNVTYSPFYVEGTTAPEKGEDLGEDIIFTPNPDDAKGAGTFSFISANILNVPQLDQGKQGDGSFGNGEDADRSKVVTALYGDCNDDGTVNTKDVLIIRKHLAGQTVVYNATNTDCNGDGTINTKDVLLLRKYLAGQKVTLGPQA